MGRRGKGEGSISRHKDGRWWGRYTVHTADGAKQRAAYGKTRAEAAEKLARAIADRDGGIVYDAGKLTVGAYLDGWLSDSVRDTVRRRTYERYEQLVRVHIAPALGGTKLKNLTPAHVRAVYRSKHDAGSPPDRPVHTPHALQGPQTGRRRWPRAPQRGGLGQAPAAP